MPALFHYVGNTETAADFNKLPPGNDHLARMAEGVQHEHDRRRIVVDHDGGFGTGQIAEHILDKGVPAAACAGLHVELKIAVAAGRQRHGLSRIFGQNGPAQIRVDDNARRVQNPLEIRGKLFPNESQQACTIVFKGQRLRVSDGASADAAPAGWTLPGRPILFPAIPPAARCTGTAGSDGSRHL